MENKLINTLQFGYDAIEKEKIKLFNTLREGMVGIIQQGKMDLLQLSNIETLTKFDNYARITWRVALRQLLIAPMIAKVKRQINRTEEEHCSGQRL